MGCSPCDGQLQPCDTRTLDTPHRFPPPMCARARVSCLSSPTPTPAHSWSPSAPATGPLRASRRAASASCARCAPSAVAPRPRRCCWAGRLPCWGATRWCSTPSGACAGPGAGGATARRRARVAASARAARWSVRVRGVARGAWRCRARAASGLSVRQGCLGQHGVTRAPPCKRRHRISHAGGRRRCTDTTAGPTSTHCPQGVGRERERRA